MIIADFSIFFFLQKKNIISFISSGKKTNNIYSKTKKKFPTFFS